MTCKLWERKLTHTDQILSMYSINILITVKMSSTNIILVSLALISLIVYIVVVSYVKAPGSVYATSNAYKNTTNSKNFDSTGKNDTLSTNMMTGLRIGSNPDAIAVNPKTDTIYVAHASSKRISVIDGHTDKVIKTIAIDSKPSAFALISEIAVDPSDK